MARILTHPALPCGPAVCQRATFSYGIALWAGLLVGIGNSGTAPAAETLLEAMAAAYLGNPTLEAERARQRATDEVVPQALSGWRPTVTVRADAGLQWGSQPRDDPGHAGARDGRWGRSVGLTLGLSQPLFRGFKTVSETQRAEATVAAGLESLRATEQSVLVSAATSYMDVLRDRDIVALRRRSVAAHREELRALEGRLAVGDVTRTDVQQAEARASLAQAELSEAHANLAASTAAYVQIVGRQPGTLHPPERPAIVPSSLQDALAIADRLNPGILAATFDADAARHQIAATRADLLPSVSLEAEFRASHDPVPGTHASSHGVVMAVLRMPLYQSGRAASRVREAKHVASQRQIQVIDAGRSVRSSVIRIWNVFVASGETIKSRRAQVLANQSALAGVRREAELGGRAVLDVLDAERELVQSRISLVTAQRNHIVAAYQLIAATGRLTAADLMLPVRQYDPHANLIQLRGSIFGIGAEVVQPTSP